MRVMVLVKAIEKREAGTPLSERLLAAMGKYNEQLVKAGIVLAAERLQPSSTGKRLTFSNGKRNIVDLIAGPLAGTKEVIVAFWLWQVRSMDEAMEWARRCPEPIPGEDAELEIRPIIEVDPLGAQRTGDVGSPDGTHPGGVEKRAGN